MTYTSDQLPLGLDPGDALGAGDALVGEAAGGTKAVAFTVSQVMTAILAMLGDVDGTLAGNSDLKLATQKALKSYVDGKVAGLAWKASVRAASTANVTLASALVNSLVMDGVTLATGDRVLLKNQTAPAENGVYVVPASGAASRAIDAATAAQLLQASMYVQEGTAGADKQFVLTTNAPITVGSTSLTFALLSTGGASLPTGGATGQALTKISGADGDAGWSSLTRGVLALTDAATVLVDATNTDQFRVTLAGNRTLANPTGLVNGQTLIFRLCQDATGTRTLAYGTKYKFAGGIAPVLSTGASAKDLLTCQYDVTDDTLYCTLNKAFA